MATIREISERTGVSIATVSKVLNEKHGVNAETRQLVMDAARELNYRPNLNARYLKSGRSQTLGIVTEDLTVFKAEYQARIMPLRCKIQDGFDDEQ